MKNILEYLENTAGRKKDEIAVDDGSRSLTWGELMDASRKIGSVLADSLTQGQPAVVLAEKSAVTLASMLGIVYAGGFYVPVHPEQPSGRICKILDTLKTEVVITEKEHLGLLKECGYRGRIILMEEALQGGINCEKLLEIRRNSRETDLLYGIFTSGSTGIPKCVVVSHKSVIRFIDHFVKIFGITEDDRIGNQAPFDFDVSVKDIYSSMATGAALVLIPRELFAMPPRLLDYLCRKKITTLIWAVSALCLISALKGLKYKVPETVRKVMFSGESMPVSQLRIWREALPDAKFVNLYGPTEITCNCTYYKVEKDFQDQDRLPIGRALPGRKVFLTDENQNEIVIPGKIGEICVAGESLSDGYYNQPEQTEEKFVPYLCEQRTYRTGDEGYYGTDGELYFAGRKDFQIKHMGRRIELEEIENALSGIPGVDSSICVFDRDRNRIIGFYKGKPASGDVRRALKEKLPPYMVPNRLLQAEDIPLNKNGKKDRAYFMRKISEETEEWKKGTRKAETGKKEIEKERERGDRGMNADKIESAVLRYGTPLYIFDMDILMEELGRFRKNLSPETGLCYAMKANPFVTEQMAAAADRIEVCSMGEFRICRNLRISPERLLISGVLKKKEDILEILDYCGRKSVYTVESPNQFYCFVKWCAEQNQDLSVYLRLTSGNQFGMDEETVIGLIRERKRYPNLKIRGIHYFSGTQKRSPEQIRKELEYLDDFLMMVKEKEQFEIQELEYGPGLAVSYFRGKEKQACRDDEIKQISGMMEKMKWKGRITLEMGRALTAMCGYYLTEVCDIKQSGNTNYCIVDGGIHQMNYDGQIRGMYMPHVSVWPGTASEGKRKETSWTVCGALCTVNDVLCRNIRLGEVKTGDVLVFERTGAYSVTEGMSLFLSHDFPKVVFYCERMGWKLVRNRMHSYVLNTPGTDDREYMDEK